MNGNGNGHGRRRPTKSWPAARRQLFAAAYIRNGGNGREAARQAGYRGTDASLRVTASRLLTRANVRGILDAKLQKAEAAIGGGISEEEVVKRLVDMARLPDTELVDAFDFISLIGPAEAVKGIKAAGDLSEAMAFLLPEIHANMFHSGSPPFPLRLERVLRNVGP